MTKISVGIYDDDIHHSLIHSALKCCLLEQQYSVKSFDDTQTSFINDFDLIFIDIDKGIGLVNAIEMRKNGYINDVILYANSNELALKSFIVHPFDYLLKPLTHNVLVKTINEYKILKKVEDKTISIRDSRGKLKYVIPISHIEYIESSNTKILFHLNNGHTILMYEKLINIEKEINDQRFLRCHQSYLINMDYVNQANDVFEMMSGSEVPIRVRNKKTVKDIYYQYLLIK